MRRSDAIHKLSLAAVIVTSTLVVIAVTAWGVRALMLRNHTNVQPQAADTGLGGFPMPGNLAPDFTLTDQFGHTVTLSSLRGREVVLAFIDSRCTSLCPLTAEIMYYAKSQLSSSETSRVELVAVNANPAATSINEVQAWSIKHGMLHQWLFLTGTAQQLQSIYRQYQVYDQVSSNGSVIHDPVTYIIDAQGRERLYFETLDSNSQSDLKSQEVGLESGMRQWLPPSQ